MNVFYRVKEEMLVKEELM